MQTTDQKIDRLLEGFDGLNVKVDRLQKDVSGLKEDVGGLKVDVSGLKEDVGGLKEESRSLRKDVDHLIEVVIDVQTTTESMDGRIGRLEVSHERAFRKMDEFLGILKRHDVENVSLLSASDRLAERVERLEKERMR